MNNQLWKREFGLKLDVPAELEAFLLAEGFEDSSYHNDTCGSFERNISKQRVLRVYVDFPSPEDREHGESVKRFAVGYTYDDGSGFEPIIDTDDTAALISKVKEILANKIEVPVAKRIEYAIENADLAFWAEIAKAFPEAKSGDFPPDLTYRMHREMTYWLEHWLTYNAPSVMEYVPDSDQWFAAVTRHLADVGAELENTGGGILCIGIRANAYYLLFGTANENWGADVYVKEYCGDLHSSLNLENAPTDTDPLSAANAIRAAVLKFREEHP